MINLYFVGSVVAVFGTIKVVVQVVRIDAPTADEEVIEVCNYVFVIDEAEEDDISNWSPT